MIVYANSLGFIESGEGPATLGEVSAPHPFSWMSETVDLSPEFSQQYQFHLASTKPVDEFVEARELGVHTRPVLLGPLSFLLLGKTHRQDVQPLTLLDRLLPVYEELLKALATAGADWIQMDEPCLVLDLDVDVQTVFRKTYARLSAVSSSLRLLLATYFADLGPSLPVVLHLPVAAVHLDLARAPE